MQIDWTTAPQGAIVANAGGEFGKCDWDGLWYYYSTRRGGWSRCADGDFTDKRFWRVEDESYALARADSATKASTIKTMAEVVANAGPEWASKLYDAGFRQIVKG